GTSPGQLAVVREPFASYDQPPSSLSQLVQALGTKAAAVAGIRMSLLPELSTATSSSTASPVLAATAGLSQSSNEVLMVAPTAFGFNEQAA
ncbi:uncharacterized protein HaLaN_14765, partial [Haematococcus lacustris]